MEAQREREECIWERARKTYLLLLSRSREVALSSETMYVYGSTQDIPSRRAPSFGGGGRARRESGDIQVISRRTSGCAPVLPAHTSLLLKVWKSSFSHSYCSSPLSCSESSLKHLPRLQQLHRRAVAGRLVLRTVGSFCEPVFFPNRRFLENRPSSFRFSVCSQQQ